jgi:hypothetical protein
MFKDIKIIVEENKDIKNFFEKSLGEKYLLSHIIKYASKTHTEKYIEWKHNLPKNETIFQKYVRENKMAVHAFKYNKKAIREYDLRGGNELTILVDNISLADDIHKNDIRSYIEFPISLSIRPTLFENNYLTVPRYCDILNCISFHKYKPGSIFHIYIGKQIVSTITITKENRYELFIPINNRLPIYLISIQYMGIYITSPNVFLDKTIYFYGTFLNTRDRKALACNNGSLLYDDNGNYLVYKNGFAQIIGISKKNSS